MKLSLPRTSGFEPLVRVEGQEHSEHPSLEILAAYHEDLLQPEAADEIREHLVGCTECSTIILDLAATAELPGDSDLDLPSTELTEAWRRQWAALQAQKQSPSPFPRRRLPSWILAAAASIAFSLLGMGAWIVSLRETIQELREPQTNSPIVNLEPLGRERDFKEPPVLRFTSGLSRGWVVFNLLGERQLDESPYRIEIRTLEGPVVWTQEGLTQDGSGSLRLEWPQGFLDPGVYRIVISRPIETEPDPVVEYRLRIAPLVDD